MPPAPEEGQLTPQGQDPRPSELRRGQSRWLTTTGEVFVLLCLAAGVAGYFVVHKGWGGTLPAAPLLAIADLVLAFSLVALAGGLGHWVLGGCDSLNPLERFGLQAGVGLGILSLLVLLVGLIGVYRAWIAWAGLLLGVLLLWRHILAWLRSGVQLRETLEACGGLGWLSFFFLCFVSAMSLMVALAPALEWDALVYHLALPKLYLSAGRIYLPEGGFYFGMPELAEMLYLWAMGLRSSSTAAVLGWEVGALAMVSLAGLAYRRISRPYAWVAPAVLFSGATVSRMMGWAYEDLWTILFAVLLLLTLDLWLESSSRQWLVVSGVCAGMMIGTKYTAALVVLAAGLALLILSSPRSARALGIFWGTALLVAAPWLVRNGAFTGNPFFPLLIPTPQVDALELRFFSAAGQSTRTLWDDLVLPVAASIFGQEGAPGFSASIGPLMVALVPGLLLSRGRFSRESARLLTAAGILGLSGWVGWAALAHASSMLVQSRMYFGFFPALSLLAVGGLTSLVPRQCGPVRIWVLASVLVGLGLILEAFNEGLNFASLNPIPVLAGEESAAQFLAQRLGWYEPAMEAVNSLPPGSKVVFLWEPRGFYCTTNCLPDAIIDRWWHLLRVRGDSRSIVDLWREQGVTHVLIYEAGARKEQEESSLYQPSDWEQLRLLEQTQLVRVADFGGVYSLYKVPRASSP
ncbi:MAG: hypothetical protein ABSG98_07225 [Anaerolineales bacterium]|jgi:hypothetical protein